LKLPKLRKIFVVYSTYLFENEIIAEIDFFLLISKVCKQEIYNADYYFYKNGACFITERFVLITKVHIQFNIVDQTHNMHTRCDNPIYIAHDQVYIPQIHKEYCTMEFDKIT
jgi:hypothetical protein